MNSILPRFELLNGEFVESETPQFLSNNRAFKYGDGLFETIKVVNDIPLFFDDHFNRFSKGMKVLKLSFRDDFDDVSFKKYIIGLIKKNSLSSARIRLTVFREGNGLYLPESETTGWHMSASVLENSNYQFKSDGLRMGIYTEAPKSPSFLSNIKTLNCATYILAAINSRELGFDENFITNAYGNIVETVSSNLFVYTNGKFLTPPLSDGCLDGVMRKNVIRIALLNGLNIEEKSITHEILAQADEILLTNVIKGIQWVSSFQDSTYTNEFAKMLNNWLNEDLGLFK